MTKYGVIIVLVVLLVGGAVYAFYRPHKQAIVEQPTPSETPEESAMPFSIVPATGYELHESTEGVYTVENDQGDGFQITVSDFDEPGPITEERIRQDLPDEEINEPAWYELDHEKAFVFYGNDADLGETYEVWAVHNGKLYQMMGKKSDEKIIENMLSTWKWR